VEWEINDEICEINIAGEFQEGNPSVNALCFQYRGRVTLHGTVVGEWKYRLHF
jgi:hypothetical protein